MLARRKRRSALVEEAVGAARELKLPRLLSTALLASAEVRLAGGDGRGALADAQAAQKMFASARTTRIGVARVAGVGEVRACLRATAQPHTITPSAPRPVERLSRLAGATTTTGDTCGGLTFKSVCSSSGNCSEQGRSFNAQEETEHGTGKEGDPGGGQGGGGKKKPAKKGDEEEVAR